MDIEKKPKGLLDYFNVSGGGGQQGFGGRFGLNSVPLTDNIQANLGVSGYYSPQYNVGALNNYDAEILARFGKDKQHSLGVGASGLNIDPRYFLNYQYNFK